MYNPDSELDRLAKRVLSVSTIKTKDLFFELYTYALLGSQNFAR